MVKDDCASNTIPLPNVSSKTMTKVIEYWKKHLELEETDELKTFDKNFLKVHLSELCDLIIAANYLDDKELLDALLIEPEEICQAYNIKYVKKRSNE
ncbi:SKP1-like protein 6 [Nicotiana sylvestris]|uniref:SKP1-like protein 6 n=1 Tax=Nicotiana sylvestris TaxID=4096 RepID=A0A1U7Y6H3_NICSY|nr:PREDICTED: SKP1-like protein 6 [Nicotiana sylvestris]